MTETLPTVAEEVKPETVVSSLVDLTSAVAARIQRNSEEIQKFTEILNDGFNNDASYKEISDKIRDLQNQRKAVKAQIMNIPSVLEISNKIKSLKIEKKEDQLSLSDYLLEVERLTGGSQLELFDGEIYDIRKTAKLVRTTHFNK